MSPGREGGRQRASRTRRLVLGIAMALGCCGAPALSASALPIADPDALRRWQAAPASRAEGYIEANTLNAFYHELGHALIHQLDLPIYAQEEDAADVFAVVVLDFRFPTAKADRIAEAGAEDLLAFAAEEEGGDDDLWTTHDPSRRRAFQLVCLHYGGHPAERRSFAARFGLPEWRAESCETDRFQAGRSWGAVLDEIRRPETGSGRFVLRVRRIAETGAQATLLATLEREVAAWNTFVHLPEDIVVSYDACDEGNSFYEADRREIALCSGLAEELEANAEASGAAMRR